MNWRFPAVAERDVAAAVVLIGENIDGILNAQGKGIFQSDATLYQHFSIVSAIDTCDLSKDITGFMGKITATPILMTWLTVADPMAVMARYAKPLYTTNDAIPPPSSITNMASTLLAALEQVFVDYIPEFDAFGAPDHIPYMYPPFIALSDNLDGSKITACIVDVYRILKIHTGMEGNLSASTLSLLCAIRQRV